MTDIRDLTDHQKERLQSVYIYIEGHEETDKVMAMLKHHNQSTYSSSNHLQNKASRIRENGVLATSVTNNSCEFKSMLTSKKDYYHRLDQYKSEERITTLGDLEELLCEISGKGTTNYVLPVPEITLEKDSIADLSKRLIDLYMKEHGLKCKISVEPFESSYK